MQRSIKLRLDQPLPAGDWDEIVLAIGLDSEVEDFPESSERIRLALPVYTPEPDFNRLRNLVKALLRKGYSRWECSDLATLRMLKTLGVTEISADWSLNAFNSQALALLRELGIKRFTASPENNLENLVYLKESGYEIDFLVQQSTPLFISLHRPAAEVKDLSVYPWGRLWITTRPVPRTFEVPSEVPTRIDLSWDPA